MHWGIFKKKHFCPRIIYFLHVLLHSNLIQINISCGFGNIKAINLLCQQAPAQLTVTLKLKVKQNYIANIDRLAL